MDCFNLNRQGFLIVPILLSVLLFSASESSVNAQGSEEIYIIANNSFKFDKISMSDTKRVFKKQKTRISGVSVVPINAKPDSALRKAFSSKILGMSISDEKSFWQDQKVRTGTQPPAEFGNTVKAVFSLKSGIGYCFKSQYKPRAAKILLKI